MKPIFMTLSKKCSNIICHIIGYPTEFPKYKINKYNENNVQISKEFQDYEEN